MKGVSGWSYSPYRPFLFETGDIYINRIVPDAVSVHLEWLADGCSEYSVYARKKDCGKFLCYGKTDANSFDISWLEPGADYEFFVSSGDRKSRIRLAYTGTAVGTVVNYLHPEDEAYSFSGRFLCSPSLLRLPDGALLASTDLYKGGAPQNLTLIFRSEDNGKTWHYLSELMPCFWGKLFLHKEEVYILACSTEYGDLLIGRSPDFGKTFGTPSVLLRGSCKSDYPGVHKNPQNIMRYKGRIYETLEWGTWGRNYHAAMVMSCDENDDILNPVNWHFTTPVKYDSSWPGTAKGESSGNIEGTLAIAPDGKLYNIMRYDTSHTEPRYGLVLAYLVNTDNPDAPLEYSHAISFPANLSKFMIKRDEKGGEYYSLATRISAPEAAKSRTLLSLMVSDDLEKWDTAADIYDFRDCDPRKVGFQYVDFEIEGNDIIFLCRTAINGADSYHNSNYLTYGRIADFRNPGTLSVEPY